MIVRVELSVRIGMPDMLCTLPCGDNGGIMLSRENRAGY